MAFDDDKSFLLPKPPPPRPARRDAAIEAALRRFDGIEEPPSAAADRQRAASPPLMSWARKHRPQFGMLVSATLIAVIGLPAALIAIRDRPPIPSRETAPVTSESRQDSLPCAARDCAADSTAPLEIPAAPPSAARIAEAPSMTPPLPVAPPVRAELGKALSSRANSQFAAREAASPPAAVAPAPPPPPPPVIAEKVAQEEMAGQVVVTGSRIPSPSKSSVGSERLDRSASDAAAGRAAAMDAAAAPDWVLKDRSFETFLTRLQSAVRANDRNAVAQLIAFPLRVNFNGRSQLYRDARSVGRDYDRIFTPKVRRAILNQRFNRLFGRDQGVMIGNGEVWFDHSCTIAECPTPGPVRIKAVNP